MTNTEDLKPKSINQPIAENAPGSDANIADREENVGVSEDQKTDISRNIESLSTEWQRENASEQSVLTPERAAEGDRDRSDAV